MSTILTFAAGQTDRLLLGKLVTLNTLGVYGVAMTMATMPKAMIAALAARVLFPGFALLGREDRDQLSHKVIRTRGVLLSVSVVAMVGMIVGSPAFFRFLYDSRYWDAGWMAPLLCMSVWFAVLQASADGCLLSLGDTRRLTIVMFWKFAATAVCCWGGAMS